MDGSGEVGWTVRADRWGQGYATEIGRAACDLAFKELGATEVVAFTEHHNRRSLAVMDRLGMAYVRDFTRRGLVEGRDGLQERASFALYAIPASAYPASPRSQATAPAI
jgi:RimJ/RimL family protein N-acetyltransferase